MPVTSDGMQKGFVGAANLVEVYLMLRQYAEQHHGSVDGIYDHNVRKWLGKRAKSVNSGIMKTLDEEPRRFIAYNNGITIVCQSFSFTSSKLELVAPQVVNGCQTTRTLYSFMETHFAGLAAQLREKEDVQSYRESFLPFKVIQVDDMDSDLVKDITRFSNRQNAVRGRDFLTLEDEFRTLKKDLAQRGYFLEVQTGEYGVLPKSQQVKFPTGRVINAFDALRFYGAGVIGKPHVAFGRSGDFTPGGAEFDGVMKNLSADDLLYPWLVAQDAQQGDLHYSVGAKWHTGGEDHQNQTRYFFLYLFYRVAREVLFGSPVNDAASRPQFYSELAALRLHWLTNPDISAPYHRLLAAADESVATYMALAKNENWYADRNAFLKSADLLTEARIVQVTTIPLMKRGAIKKDVDKLLSA